MNTETLGVMPVHFHTVEQRTEEKDNGPMDLWQVGQ